MNTLNSLSKKSGAKQKILNRKTKTLYVRGKGFAPGKRLPVGVYRCTREHDGSGGPDGLYCVKVGQ